MTADDDKKRRLEMTVDAIRATHGQMAIRRLRPRKQIIPHISTGFPVLDQALGIGGLPRGQMSEMVSIPSSGTATIALNIVAQAQAEGLAIYLDIDQNFDPTYAAQLGVDLDRLLLVEPNTWREGCAIMRDFILEGQISILVFDTPAHVLGQPRYARTLSTTLDRLATPLSKTSCTLLFLITLLPDTPQPAPDQAIHSVLAHHAAVRLVVYRMRWLFGRRGIRGYGAKIYIAKNKFAPVAGPVTLTIGLAGEEGNGW
jgi:recombination protein RecA